MKKITDERLILVNLKNIRIAFVCQTLGILATLFYTAFRSGADIAFQSPLFFVLIMTNVLLIFLQMRVTADFEETKRKRKKVLPYYACVLISLAVGAIIGTVAWTFDRQHPLSAWIIGIVFFVCFLASYSLMYFLKKKRSEDDDE